MEFWSRASIIMRGRDVKDCLPPTVALRFFSPTQVRCDLKYTKGRGRSQTTKEQRLNVAEYSLYRK